MVVINKAGGSGAVGTQFVVNAKPDGYTLLYSLNTLSEMPHIDALLGRPVAFKKEQFIPIGQITVTPVRHYGQCRVPVEDVSGVCHRDQAETRGFSVRLGGRLQHHAYHVGAHLVGHRHLPTHMPTTGGGPIMTAVLGKHVDIGHCVVPAVCGPQVEAGKIRLLAMTSEARHPAYPDVPTLRELGYDVTHAIWHAPMAPAGTPPEIVATLRKALKSMVEDEAFKALLDKLNERVQYMSGEAFEQFLEQDYQKSGEILRQIVKK
jgi:tripartite-type tricarboxylate transporter receptor subunit TctC